MMRFIYKIFKDLCGAKADVRCLTNNNVSKKYSSTKYTSKPIEFKNKNIVYPDNKTEKEIKALYSEIRDLQAKNREKIEKNKLVYYSR